MNKVSQLILSPIKVLVSVDVSGATYTNPRLILFLCSFPYDLFIEANILGQAFCPSNIAKHP
jgi:hypothetical protein